MHHVQLKPDGKWNPCATVCFRQNRTKVLKDRSPMGVGHVQPWTEKVPAVMGFSSSAIRRQDQWRSKTTSGVPLSLRKVSADRLTH